MLLLACEVLDERVEDAPARLQQHVLSLVELAERVAACAQLHSFPLTSLITSPTSTFPSSRLFFVSLSTLIAPVDLTFSSLTPSRAHSAVVKAPSMQAVETAVSTRCLPELCVSQTMFESGAFFFQFRKK